MTHRTRILLSALAGLTLSGCQSTRWMNAEAKPSPSPFRVLTQPRTLFGFDGKNVELGIRSDGVVVWRDAK